MPLEKLGPYKLEKVLGRGGMGAVYAGVNTQTGERAAVKVLSAHLADDESFRERFKIEVETLKRLLHPHIVQLFGYGEEDGHLFYVMELVDGRSLQDELTAGRRFHWREVARIGIAVAQALKHAHDRGIIHRDLKPANLLIDQQDHVKLTDFGIAKLYGGTNVTADGGVLGTADYMAPEQAEGKQITSRCDLYALGSVLYALLTGRPPFGGRTIVQVISALKNETPVSIRRLAPDTPAAFEEIVFQLLEKDPQKRIPTALALSNRLRAMEHALSLETRVGPLPSDDEPPVVPPISLAGPSAAGLTVGMESGSRPTAPLDTSDDDEYHVAGEAPTIVTGVGTPPAASRTSLSTQAGKVTGSVHARQTEAIPDDRRGAAITPAEKITRFTTVSEDELRGSRDTDEPAIKQWIAVGALAVIAMVAISVTLFLVTRPPSADQLYAKVKAAISKEGAEGLQPVESELNRFLSLYAADPRAAEMQQFQEELELHRLERSFERRAKRPVGVEGLLPVERAYLDAVQRTATDPATALAQFEAMEAVFGGPPDASLSPLERRSHTRCLDLARRQVARLKATVDKLATEQRLAIRRQLERADRAGSPAEARAIYEGLLTLYADKAWAAELIDETRRKLDALGE